MKSILCSAILAAVSAVTVPAATVALQYSPNPVMPGDLFTMTVNVTDVFGGRPGDVIFGFGFTPTISDPGKVAFVSAAVGSQFLDVSSGGVIIGAAIPPLGDGDFTEPLTLATLTFQTMGSGFVDVGIRSDLLDPNQGLVYLLDSVDLTTAGSIDVVPEPGSGWLLAAGMSAVWMGVRRRYNRTSGSRKNITA